MKTTLLVTLFFLMRIAMAQETPYGLNANAGKYCDVGDAKIYYEVYGEGPALVLLHGDVFGYIDEFSSHIPVLSKDFTVIAVGLRGHGKSELGSRPFSYQLLAEDVYRVLRQEKTDSVIVMGFSAGAIIGYNLAANHPGLVKKLVAIGGTLSTEGYRKEELPFLQKMNLKDLEASFGDFIKGRKKIMVQPERYQELIDKLKSAWFQGDYLTPKKVTDIACPVLTIGGDRDNYFDVDEFSKTFKRIRNSQLAIIPNCDHVGLIFNDAILHNVILPFILTRR